MVIAHRGCYFIHNFASNIEMQRVYRLLDPNAKSSSRRPEKNASGRHELVDGAGFNSCTHTDRTVQVNYNQMISRGSRIYFEWSFALRRHQEGRPTKIGTRGAHLTSRQCDDPVS